MTGRHAAPRAAQRRSARVVETSDYVAFLTRAMIAWGDRIAADPAALVHMHELLATMDQQTNRGIWEANRRGTYSQNHMAKVLGVTRQAIAYRIRRGEVAASSLIEARGGGALVRIGEIRARRARLLAAAQVPDLTGSEKERALRVVNG